MFTISRGTLIGTGDQLHQLFLIPAKAFLTRVGAEKHGSRVMPVGSTHSPSPELTFEFPTFRVRCERFAEPMKGVGRDLRKPPAGRGAVGTNAKLHDVLVHPAADLFFVMIAGG